MLGGGVGAHLVVEDVVAGLTDALLHAWLAVEAVFQGVLNRLAQYAEALLTAFLVEIAVGFGEGDILHHVVPDFLQAELGIGGAEEHLDRPLGVGQGEEMERVSYVSGGEFGALHVYLGLVYRDHVGHFHDAAFHALKLVAGVGELEQEEEIDHGVGRHLGLPDTDGLDNDDVEAGGLAEEDDFAGFARDAAERTRRRGRANEGVGIDGEAFHAGFVAEDAAFGALARRVDGEDGHLVVVGGEHAAEGLDGGALTDSRHPCDAQPDRLAAVGQAALNDLLRLGLVVVERALDEGDGAAEHGAVAVGDARDHLLDRNVLAPGGTGTLDVAVAHLLGLSHTVHNVEGGLVIEIAVKMMVVGRHGLNVSVAFCERGCKDTIFFE